MRPSKTEQLNLIQTLRAGLTSICAPVFILCLLVASSSSVLAQQPGSLTQHLNDTGEQMGRDSVNVSAPHAAFTGIDRPEIGSFRMSLPLVNLPGRGMNVKLNLNYDSSLYQLETNGLNWYVKGTELYSQYPGRGFTLGYGMLIDHNAKTECRMQLIGGGGTCPHPSPGVSYYGALTFIDETGAKHRIVNGVAVDSSDLRYTVQGSTRTITTPDGTTYVFGAAHTRLADSWNSPSFQSGTQAVCVQYCDTYDYLYYPVKIIDRNGNFITITSSGPNITTIKDTLGREIKFNYDPQTRRLASIDVPGFTPDTRREVVRFFYRSYTVTWNFRDQTPSNTTYTFTGLESLYFPGTKSGWHFDYSSYGQLWLIQKLLGMQYDAASNTITNLGTEVAKTSYSYNGTPLNTNTSLLYTLPNYKERIDEWRSDPSDPAKPMMRAVHKYTMDYSSEINLKRSITYIEAPDGTVNVIRKRYYKAEDHSPDWAKTWDEGVVLEEKAQLGSKIFRKINYNWEKTAHGARLIDRTVTNDIGQQQKTVYRYHNPNDPSFPGVKNYMNVREVIVYGFDGTTELRRTVTDYVRDSNWTNRWLIKLPTSVKIYQSGLTAPISQTEFEYDNEPLTSYDELLTDQSKMYDKNTPAQRGNPTKTTKHTDGAGGVAVINKAKYDITGNVVEKTDGNNKASLFEYSADYNRAYPTKVKTPAPDPLGVSGSDQPLETNSVYNPNTGLLVTLKDAIGQSASYDYSDPINRVKKVSYPDGGSTTYEYSETPTNISIITRTDVDGSKTKESRRIFNGRGQAIRVQTSAGDNLYSTIDTEYDLMTHVARTSNAYLTGADQTPSPDTRQWTSKIYDNLGRVLTVKMPDNLQTGREYNGQRMLMTDPANKQRLIVKDELGRTTEVWEILPATTTDPNAESVSFPGHAEVVKGYRTSYKYDTLDNMRSVKQGQQQRFFMYDSLSRLVRVKLPEQEVNSSLTGTDPITQNSQWSLFYEYDNNNNIKVRTDARGVITNYDYDAINRVIKRSYQNDPTLTPTATYKYDGAGITNGIQYSLNKLTEVSTSGSFVSKCTYDVFDIMGRVKQVTETVESNPAFVLRYGYDLAGNLISQTYPSGRTVNTDFDSAGRIAGIRKQGSNDYYAGGEPGSTSAIQYAAHGVVRNLRLGNGLWETTAFDNARQQVAHFKLGRTPDSSDKLQLDYDFGAQNNGSLRGQTIAVPTVGTVPGFTATHAYDYDELDRLKSMSETGGIAQGFGYDQYGNRAIVSGTVFNPLTPQQLSAYDTLTNRLRGKEYDKAGNVTRDAIGQGSTYQYDGENRLITVDGGGTATYGYNAEGRRVKRTALGFTSIYVYNTMGGLVAEYGGPPTQGEGGTSYLTSDMQGTPRIITGPNINDSKGGVRARHDYAPFGEELGVRADGQRNSEQRYFGINDGVRQKFTGHERDRETGLDFAKTRFYDSSAGRFFTPDPLLKSARAETPQSMNRYAYAGNNPLKFTDPTGLDWYYNIDEAITNRRAEPVFFSGQPPPGWELWTKISSYAYCSDTGKCWALDPYDGTATQTGTLKEAQQKVHNRREYEFVKDVVEPIKRNVAPIPKAVAIGIGGSAVIGAGIGIAAPAILPTAAEFTTLSIEAAPVVMAENLTVIGGLAETQAFNAVRGFNVLRVPNARWSEALNRDWVNLVIEARSTVYLATPGYGAGSMTATEIYWLTKAGYTQWGCLLLPPF